MKDVLPFSSPLSIQNFSGAFFWKMLFLKACKMYLPFLVPLFEHWLLAKNAYSNYLTTVFWFVPKPNIMEKAWSFLKRLIGRPNLYNMSRFIKKIGFFYKQLVSLNFWKYPPIQPAIQSHLYNMLSQCLENWCIFQSSEHKQNLQKRILYLD